MSLTYSLYKDHAIKNLCARMNTGNIFMCPKIVKVVVHAGFGKRIKEAAYVEKIRGNLTRITGQKPVDAKAKKSISNFKLRKGTVIGMFVTLRGGRMYDFLDRLIHVVMPRVPDFRGISLTSVDTQGNLHIGFKDQVAFPELSLDDISDPHGLQVSIITNAHTRTKGEMVCKELGFPFVREETKQ